MSGDVASNDAFSSLELDLSIDPINLNINDKTGNYDLKLPQVTLKEYKLKIVLDGSGLTNQSFSIAVGDYQCYPPTAELSPSKADAPSKNNKRADECDSKPNTSPPRKENKKVQTADRKETHTDRAAETNRVFLRADHAGDAGMISQPAQVFQREEEHFLTQVHPPRLTRNLFSILQDVTTSRLEIHTDKRTPIVETELKVEDQSLDSSGAHVHLESSPSKRIIGGLNVIKYSDGHEFAVVFDERNDDPVLLKRTVNTDVPMDQPTNLPSANCQARFWPAYPPCCNPGGPTNVECEIKAEQTICEESVSNSDISGLTMLTKSEEPNTVIGNDKSQVGDKSADEVSNVDKDDSFLTSVTVNLNSELCFSQGSMGERTPREISFKADKVVKVDKGTNINECGKISRWTETSRDYKVQDNYLGQHILPYFVQDQLRKIGGNVQVETAQPEVPTPAPTNDAACNNSVEENRQQIEDVPFRLEIVSEHLLRMFFNPIHLLKC